MSKRVFAIASAGGHWEQLMLLSAAFAGTQLRFATTLPGLPERAGLGDFCIVPDCNRDTPWRIARSLARIFWEVARFRPDVVISTGALPGMLALVCGRIVGARTIWVDSVANAEEMSASGRSARRFAHLWLSQWQQVAEREGAIYAGRVL